MAKIKFLHTSHDTIRQVYVKKKTFRYFLIAHILTIGVLVLFAYQLHNYGYFSKLLRQVNTLIKS